MSLEDFYNYIRYREDSVDGQKDTLVKNSIELQDVRIQFESKPQ
jgi:hypothetical protein